MYAAALVKTKPRQTNWRSLLRNKKAAFERLFYCA
jgi:hypothetical protein